MSMSITHNSTLLTDMNSLGPDHQPAISIPQPRETSPLPTQPTQCTQDKCAAFLRDGRVLCDLRCIDPLALRKENDIAPVPPRPIQMPKASITHQSSPESERETAKPTASTATSTTATKRDSYWSAAKRRRLPHHVIERRYRDNLNGQIEALRLVVGPNADGQSEDVEDGAFTKAPSKAEVIASATDYIKDLLQTVERLQAQEKALKEQVQGLERLVRCEDCEVLKYLGTMQVGVDRS